MTARFVTTLRICLLACVLASFTTAVAAAASPIRQLTVTEAANLRPMWNADHTKIAYQSNRDGTYHIYVMDADGSNTKQLSSGADTDDRHPAWSPDGKFIAVDSGTTSQREIWIIEVATQRRTQITRAGAFASFPSWSPDGKRIAFYIYRSGTMDLWTTGRDGAGTTQLTKSLASEQQNQCTFACHAARWSPDSTRLAFSDGDLTHVLILSAVANTGAAPTVISPDGERNHFPVYLKDGTIVYVSEHLSLDQSWTDLWMVDPNSSGQRTEVAKGILAQGPFELTNDGTQLLFASPRSGNFEIYAVTLDADGKSALATSQFPSGAVIPAQRAAAPAIPGLSPEAYIFLGVALFALIAEIAYRVLRRRRRLAAR
jgi:Tol biopolymer transport system component